MYTDLVKWLLSIPSLIAPLFKFLFTPLEYINLSPITMFGIGGITIIIGVHLFNLFVRG